MAHEILSAKLCELDSELAKLHGNIRRSDQLSGERLAEEIRQLECELDDQEDFLKKSLEQSKAMISAPLLTQLIEFCDWSSTAKEELEKEIASVDDRELQCEKRMLLAEYGIDMALLIAKESLLAAMKAIQSQQELEKEEAR